MNRYTLDIVRGRKLMQITIEIGGDRFIVRAGRDSYLAAMRSVMQWVADPANPIDVLIARHVDDELQTMGADA